MVSWWYGFWMCWGMFCAIPCPVKIWKEEARPRMLRCLPLLGLALGGVWCLPALLPAGPFRAAVLTVVPWLLTGGIHLDGFMDCCDAIFSRRDLEMRQKILKDPHVGSFAVMGLAVLALLTFGLWSGSGSLCLPALLLLPVSVRACAAVAVTCMRPLGHSQYAALGKSKLPLLPLVCLLAACILPLCLYGLQGLAPLAGALGYGLAVVYASRQLGGVSGDVSGFALTIGEACGAAALTLL